MNETLFDEIHARLCALVFTDGYGDETGRMIQARMKEHFGADEVKAYLAVMTGKTDITGCPIEVKYGPR